MNENLKQLLLALPTARLASGGREVVMRCRYCGDSHNPRSAHFYVSLGHDDTPLFFNCFKCHTSGILSRETLMDWGIFDVDALMGVTSYNNKALSLAKNKRFSVSQVYNIRTDFILDHPYSYKKLEYINNRLGLELTMEDIKRLKITLNLLDLLNSNNIVKYTRHAKIIDELNLSFMGFITQDNAFINMRNLRFGKTEKPLDKRYINYSIFDKFDSSQRRYIIPTTIDLSLQQRTQIHIAEGPFDILSIYFNLMKQANGLYTAILGSGYFNTIKHFITVFGIAYSEVHIYKDKDIDMSEMYRISNWLRNFDIPFYVHMNMYEGEKDFGVPINNIIDQVIKLN